MQGIDFNSLVLVLLTHLWEKKKLVHLFYPCLLDAYILPILTILNFRVLNQNLMNKRDECKWNFMLIWYFSQIYGFWKLSEMLNYQWNFENVVWPIKFQKLLYMKIRNLWVSLGKSFISCTFVLAYLFRVLKSSQKKQEIVIIFIF